MSLSKYSLIFLLSAIIAQTACAAASRAENTANLPSEKHAAHADSQQIQTPVKTAPTPKPATKKPSNEVCGDPLKPCQHREKTFAEWELSFQMPARLTANKTYRSAPFYAVIVKKYEEGCAELDENPDVEPERLRLQKRFAANKVFAEYSCPNLSAVIYEFDGKRDAAGETVLYMDYLAVYAGSLLADAERLRDELKEEFPRAEIKKMTANFGIIEQ